MRERFLPPTLSTPPGGIPSQIDPDFGVALRATSPFANRGREPFVQGMLHPCGECGQKCCYLHFRITDLSTVGSISKIGQVLGTLNFVKSGRMNVRTLCTLRHVRYVRYVMYVTSCTLRHVRYVRYVMYATSCTLCALRHVRYVMYVTYATLCTLRTHVMCATSCTFGGGRRVSTVSTVLKIIRKPACREGSFPSTPARSSILQSAEGVPYPLL